MQKFSDAPLTLHDGSCGGSVERLLGVPALQFKGTGWYVTDYARGKTGGNGDGKPKSSASEASSGAAAKPEAGASAEKK